MRALVVVLCALALAPAASARPLLGLYGDTARFTAHSPVPLGHGATLPGRASCTYNQPGHP